MTTAAKRTREELEDLAERVEVAEAALSRVDGWLYRKWHVAESARKRLEADAFRMAGQVATVKSIRDKATRDAAALDRVLALADEADRKAGGDKHDSISGRLTTRKVRRAIAGADGDEHE